MSLFNVTLHKVRVGVVKRSSEDSELDLEAMPAQDLWDYLGSGSNDARILREVVEVAEVANTTRSCPVCLSPLEIKARAEVSFIPGEGIELKDPSKVVVRCVSDETHKILPEQKELLLQELLTPT